VTIRVYRDTDRQTLKDITAICFDGVSIDQNIEKRFGRIAGKTWQWRKVRHIDADVEANPGGVFVAEEDGRVIGYITTRVDHESGIGGIPNMAVLPECQGRGIGRALMECALAYFREQGMAYAKIETLDQNAVGSAFYPRMGFEEVARQIHYVMPLER
jgi:ribosomal protein S18 acetylase RimI-like enzyme